MEAPSNPHAPAMEAPSNPFDDSVTLVDGGESSFGSALPDFEGVVVDNDPGAEAAGGAHNGQILNVLDD
jgi:hypothetical protein